MQVDGADRCGGGADGHGGRRDRGVEIDGLVEEADAACGVEGNLAAAGEAHLVAGSEDAAAPGGEADVAGPDGQGGPCAAVQHDGAGAGGRLEGDDAGAGGGGGG